MGFCASIGPPISSLNLMISFSAGSAPFSDAGILAGKEFLAQPDQRQHLNDKSLPKGNQQQNQYHRSDGIERR